MERSARAVVREMRRKRDKRERELWGKGGAAPQGAGPCGTRNDEETGAAREEEGRQSQRAVGGRGVEKGESGGDADGCVGWGGGARGSSAGTERKGGKEGVAMGKRKR